MKQETIVIDVRDYLKDAFNAGFDYAESLEMNTDKPDFETWVKGYRKTKKK